MNIKVWVITRRFCPLCNLTDLTGQTDQSKRIWKRSEERQNTRWKCGKDFWFVFLMLQASEELQPSLAQPLTWSWWVSSRGIDTDHFPMVAMVNYHSNSVVVPFILLFVYTHLLISKVTCIRGIQHKQYILKVKSTHKKCAAIQSSKLLWKIHARQSSQWKNSKSLTRKTTISAHGGVVVILCSYENVWWICSALKYLIGRKLVFWQHNVYNIIC